jgi:hypothetical protein
LQRGVIGTDELFTFELDMGTGKSAVPAERLEETKMQITEDRDAEPKTA